MLDKEITLQEKITEFITELSEFDKKEINKALEESHWQEKDLQGYEKAYLTGFENALKLVLELLIEFQIDPELVIYPSIKDLFTECLNNAWCSFQEICDTEGLSEEPMDGDEVKLFSQLFECHLMFAQGNLNQYELYCSIDKITCKWR